MHALVVAGSVAGGWILACIGLAWMNRTAPVLKTNYAGREVIAILGVVLFAPLALGGLIGMFAGDDRLLAVAGAGLSMGLLGLLDDLKGNRQAGGLIGHVRALWKGTLTTGLLKAAGGAVAGLAAAWITGWRGPGWILAGAVVAMSANLANLLDLRPGRTIKVWYFAWAALLAAGPALPVAVTTGAVAGGAAAFLPSEMREHGMLGDAGANLLGGALGAGAVATMSRTPLTVLAAGLLALTLASEFVSFSRVIERVRPLRALDELGRRR